MNTPIHFFMRHTKSEIADFVSVKTDDIGDIRYRWEQAALATRMEMAVEEQHKKGNMEYKPNFSGFTPSTSQLEEPPKFLYLLTPDFDAHKSKDSDVNKGNDYYLNLFKEDPCCFAVVGSKSGGIAPIYLRKPILLDIRRSYPHPSSLYNYHDYVMNAFEKNITGNYFNGDSWYQQRYIASVLYINPNAIPMEIDEDKLKEAKSSKSSYIATAKANRGLKLKNGASGSIYASSIEGLLELYKPNMGMSNKVAMKIVQKFHFRDLVHVKDQLLFLKQCYGDVFHQRIEEELMTWFKTSSKQDDRAREIKFQAEVGTSNDSLGESKIRYTYAAKKKCKPCNIDVFRKDLENIPLGNCGHICIIAPMGYGKTHSILVNAQKSGKKLLFLVQMRALREEIYDKAQSMGMTCQTILKDEDKSLVNPNSQISVMTYAKWMNKGTQIGALNNLMEDATIICDEIQVYTHIISKICQAHPNVIFITANRIEKNKNIPKCVRIDIYEKEAKKKLKVNINISKNQKVPDSPSIHGSLCYVYSRKLCEANGGAYGKDDNVEKESVGCSKSLDDVKNEALNGRSCVFNDAIGAGISLMNKSKHMEVIVDSHNAVTHGYGIAQAIGRARNGLDEVHFYLPSQFDKIDKDWLVQGQHVVRRMVSQRHCCPAFAQLMGELALNYDLEFNINYKCNFGEIVYAEKLGTYEERIKKALVNGFGDIHDWQRWQNKDFKAIASQLLNFSNESKGNKSRSDKAMFEAFRLAKVAAKAIGQKNKAKANMAGKDVTAAKEFCQACDKVLPPSYSIEIYGEVKDDELEKDKSVKVALESLSYQKALFGTNPKLENSMEEYTKDELVGELYGVINNTMKPSSKKYERFRAYKVKFGDFSWWTEHKPKNKDDILEIRRCRLHVKKTKQQVLEGLG